ncbi:MAG: DUF501 domain-containing protein [Thermoleophilia bacterium]
MGGSRYSDADLVEIVTWQIGRRPTISFSVARECTFGWPAVIISSPFNANGDPNPNLYYLSCPYLRIALARLEDAGSIADLQQEIMHNPDLMQNLSDAQAEHDLEWRRAAGELAGSFRDDRVNIAGSGKSSHLKCLHAHYAYFLVHPDYEVGMRISGMFGNNWCDDEACGKWDK